MGVWNAGLDYQYKLLCFNEGSWLAYSHPTTAQGRPKASSNVVPQTHTPNQLITTRSFLKSSRSLSLSPWSAWRTSVHLQGSFSFSKPAIFSLSLSLSVSGWPLVQDEWESFGSHVMDSCPLNSLPLTKNNRAIWRGCQQLDWMVCGTSSTITYSLKASLQQQLPSIE